MSSECSSATDDWQVSCLFERASVNYKYTADYAAIIDGKALGELFKPGRQAKIRSQLNLFCRPTNKLIVDHRIVAIIK